MVKIKVKELCNRDFAEATRKINSAPVSGHLAYKIKKLTDLLEKERKRVIQEFQALVPDYALKDEQGNPKRPPHDPSNFEIDPNKKEEFIKAQNEFSERELKLEASPLVLEDLKSMNGLSAIDLKQLEPIYVELSEVR